MPGNNPADFDDRALPELFRTLFAALPQPVGLERKLDLGEERREITSDELGVVFERKLEELVRFSAQNLKGDSNRCFTFKLDLRGYAGDEPFTSLGTSGSITIGEGSSLDGDGSRLVRPFSQAFDTFAARIAELGGESFEFEMQAEVSAFRDVVRAEEGKGGLPFEQFLKDLGLDFPGSLPELPDSDQSK